MGLVELERRLFVHYAANARDFDEFAQLLTDGNSTKVEAKHYKKGKWLGLSNSLNGFRWGTTYNALMENQQVATYDEKYDNFIRPLIKSYGNVGLGIQEAYLLSIITACHRLDELQRKVPNLSAYLIDGEKIVVQEEINQLSLRAQTLGLRPLPMLST